MKYIRTLLLTTLFYAWNSQAAIFDFSYLFQQGYGDNRGVEPTLVTGSFSGIQEGKFVKNISDIEVVIQGREFSDNLISILYSVETGNPWDFNQEGKISFDVALNNFMIVDNIYSTEGTYTNYFYIINHPDGSTLRQALNDNNGYSYGFDSDSFLNNSWILTQREVPETSGLILLLSGGVIVAVRRGKKVRSQSRSFT